MNALVVVNQQAGAFATSDFEATANRLREAFNAAGAHATIRGITTTVDAALDEAVAQHPDALIVGGGDGTLSAAAARLAGTGIPLGVLPLGTRNHFARDLQLPMTWPEAVVTLTNGVLRDIDVGEVNGRVFINNVSLGSYAEAVRRRDLLRRERGHRKGLAMFLASCGVFCELRRQRVAIETPDGTFALRTPFVLVANNRYRGRVFDDCLRERLDEGRLWIYTTRARGHGLVLRMLWQSLMRRIDTADDLDAYAACEATVRPANPCVPVAADGELVDVHLPLHFRIRPRALRVLAPPAAPPRK